MELLTAGTIVRSPQAIAQGAVAKPIALVILTSHCVSILLRLTRFGVCPDSTYV